MPENPKDIGVGGAHSGSGKPKPFDEFLRDEVARRKLLAETDPYTIAENERIQRELEKVREKKRKRRLRNRYDFS